MNLKDYLASLQGKTVAVIGIGVSNTPLIRLLREGGIAVTACDKKSRVKECECNEKETYKVLCNKSEVKLKERRSCKVSLDCFH